MVAEVVEYMSGDQRKPLLEGFLDDGMVKGHRSMLLDAFKRGGWPEIERIAAKKGVPLSASAHAAIRQRDAHLAQQDRADDLVENERRHRQTSNQVWYVFLAGVVVSVILAYWALRQTGTPAGGSPAPAGRSTPPSAHDAPTDNGQSRPPP